MNAPPMSRIVHHTPPQHMPPAKRPRFDNQPGNNRGPPTIQPSFQTPLPSAPIGPQGSFSGGPSIPTGPSQSTNRGSGPNGRGGGPSGRGAPPLRGAKSGFIPNRGGGPGSMRGGRGGSMMNVGSDGRNGGPSRGGGPLRANGSRRGFGGGRGGGSFAGSGMNSSRGRGGHQNNGRATRSDGHGSSSGPMPLGPSSSFNAGSRKDENKRTLTDFKIVGLELADLNWSWGVTPKAANEVVSRVTELESQGTSAPTEGTTPALEDISESTQVEATAAAATADSTSSKVVSDLPANPTGGVGPASTALDLGSKSEGPVPSRLRIYFHTPASMDDSNPTVSGYSWDLLDATRKGKRKKGVDEDEDDLEIEEGRTRPRPPGEDYDRASVAPSVDMRSGSVAPSVAETTSEADWLMAAFGGERGVDGELEAEDSHVGIVGETAFEHEYESNDVAEVALSHDETVEPELKSVEEVSGATGETPLLEDSGEQALRVCIRLPSCSFLFFKVF
jgi:20S proteasome subunit alpha 6